MKTIGGYLLGMGITLTLLGFYPIFRHNDWIVASFFWSIAAICLVMSWWRWGK